MPDVGMRADAGGVWVPVVVGRQVSGGRQGGRLLRVRARLRGGQQGGKTQVGREMESNVLYTIIPAW